MRPSAPIWSNRETDLARAAELGYLLAMVDPNKLDELAGQLNRLVPSSLKAAGDDLKDNFRAVLQGWFDRLDLVTREEFDAQKAVLARTRELAESLAARLDELESN